MNHPVVAELIAPFTKMNPHDSRAIQSHVIAASSGFFVAATLLALTAGHTKKLCIRHAAKGRKELQSLADFIDKDLASLLGSTSEAQKSAADDSSGKKKSGKKNSKNNTTKKGANAPTKSILDDSPYISEAPAENSEYNAKSVGPYTSPVHDEESSSSSSSEDDDDTNSATRNSMSKRSAKAAASVVSAIAPPSEPEELSLLATLKSFANIIHSSRLEPNHEFGRSVGAEVFKLQRRVARILLSLGVRSCVDIGLAYLICVGLDRARAGTRLGNFSFFRPEVVGTGEGTGYGFESRGGATQPSDYFLSSSFRFFLFTSFSFGTAVNGLISGVLKGIGLSSIDSLLRVGTGAEKTGTVTGLSGWLSRAAYFYDDQHPSMSKRKLFFLPIFALKSFQFQVITHGFLNTMRLPSGLLPIAYESAYLPTLAQLGANEIAYWVFLQKFVYASTSLSRLLLSGQWKSIPSFVSLMSSTDRPGRIRRASEWGVKRVSNTQKKKTAESTAASGRKISLLRSVVVRGAVESVRVGLVLAVCSVAVRAADTSPNAPVGLVWSVLRLWNRCLFLVFDKRKGPAYVWSLMM